MHGAIAGAKLALQDTEELLLGYLSIIANEKITMFIHILIRLNKLHHQDE